MLYVLNYFMALSIQVHGIPVWEIYASRACVSECVCGVCLSARLSPLCRCDFLPGLSLLTGARVSRTVFFAVEKSSYSNRRIILYTIRARYNGVGVTRNTGGNNDVRIA